MEVLVLMILIQIWRVPKKNHIPKSAFAKKVFMAKIGNYGIEIAEEKKFKLVLLVLFLGSKNTFFFICTVCSVPYFFPVIVTYLSSS